MPISQTYTAMVFIEGKGTVNVTTALVAGEMWVYYPNNATGNTVGYNWKRIPDIVVDGVKLTVTSLSVTATFITGVGLTVIYTALVANGDIWINTPTNSVNDLIENVWRILPSIPS